MNQPLPHLSPANLFMRLPWVPVIPRYGSIGAGDLVLNAHMALPLIGKGEVWLDGGIIDAASALAIKNLLPVQLQPKDALALINHSCVSTAAASFAVSEAGHCLHSAKYAAALSFEGYAGNRSIFAPVLQEIRRSKGQAEIAGWFEAILAGSQTPDRKIQDALSFRVIAPVYGCAHYAVEEAIAAVEVELNGASDNPVVLTERAEILSSANFHNPMIVHCLDAVSLALVACAHSMVQRVQKLMAPDLSDLPRYLTPIGGASAGMVPVQKTANSLLAEILNTAQPAVFSVPPVSDGVEDMATLAMVSIGKLSRVLQPFRLLIGLEALVGAQAMDLRETPGFAEGTKKLHQSIRVNVALLTEDRPLGSDIQKCADILHTVASHSQ